MAIGSHSFHPPIHQSVGAAMSRAFRNWGTTCPKYKKTFAKIGDDALGLADCALSEMYDYVQHGFYHWWLHEHMRFQHVKNEQTRLVSELIYEFLSRYKAGDLQHDTNRKRTKKGRTATVEPQG